MGKVIAFPKRRGKNSLTPATPKAKRYAGTLPEVQQTATVICDALEPEPPATGLPAYRMVFQGSEALLCRLVREWRGKALRLTSEPNSYVVVMPQGVRLAEGVEVAEGEETARVISVWVLGPP